MKKIALEQLKPGMVTAEDVYANSGQQLLVPKGTTLTDLKLQLLNVFAIRNVRIEDESPESADTASAAQDEASYFGEDIPDFTSKFPQEVREARVKEIKEYKEAYNKGLNYFQVAVNNLVEKNADLNLNVDTILNQTISLLGNRGKSSILEMLIFMKERDNDIYSHCINTSLLCNMLAHWLDYSEEDCQMAAACGLFHDIGHLSLPEELLQKTEPLTPQEQDLLATHTEKGYEMLKAFDVDETVRLSALMHHEKCDGSGYPRGLQDEQIDRFAKLVNICNIYDSMTSNRPRQKAVTPFAVIEEYETRGLSKYDTRAILVFQKNTVNTYLNCPVRLTNGAVAYVVYINPGRLGRPIVQCNGEFIDLSQRTDLNIAEMLPVV